MSTSTTSAADPAVRRTIALTEQIQVLTRTMQVLRNHVAAAGHEGLPWSTYMLLFHLISGGPRRAGALAELACIDASTVSRQVDTLVRLGLVVREADPADGRATVLVPTDAGIAMKQRLMASRDRMMTDVLADWPDGDVARLTELLGRFNADLSGRLPGIIEGLQRPTSHSANDRDHA